MMLARDVLLETESGFAMSWCLFITEYVNAFNPRW